MPLSGQREKTDSGGMRKDTSWLFWQRHTKISNNLQTKRGLQKGNTAILPKEDEG